jgi:hypothetical protein
VHIPSRAVSSLIREQFLFVGILPVCHCVTPHALTDAPPPTTAPQSQFAYEYGRVPPGVDPDTRSACRHAAGTCGHRRDASAISPMCAAASWRTARMLRRGPRGSPSGPPPSCAVRADPCRCWGTRGSTGTRAGVSPTRTPCRRIAMDNPPPCGYDALMKASESVRRRRERLRTTRRPERNSRARLCGGTLWVSIVCLRGATGKAIWRNSVWRSTLPWAP